MGVGNPVIPKPRALPNPHLVVAPTGIVHRLRSMLIALVGRRNICYKSRAKAGGGEPRAGTSVLHICQSGRSRDLGVELRLVLI